MDGRIILYAMNEHKRGIAMARAVVRIRKAAGQGRYCSKKMGALGSGNASKSLKAKGDPRGLCVHAYSNNLTKYETQIMSPFSYLSSSSKKVICSSCSSSFIADIFTCGEVRARRSTSHLCLLLPSSWGKKSFRG